MSSQLSLVISRGCLLGALFILGGSIGLEPAAAQPTASGEVVAIRPLTLQADVDTAAFERFARTRYNPGWAHVTPGMTVSIMKADRGTRKGTYVLAFIFDSETTRNAYFPQEGSEGTETFQAYIREVQDLSEELLGYVEEIGTYTDYVALR